MKKAVPMILSEDNFKQIFAFADRNSRLAKLLYNAALFRIRQVFTGWNKEERTDLEKSVFAEIQCAKETYKDFTCRRVFSYKALDRTLRANKNPDFFAGLSMQTAQSIVRQATIDFKAWLDALKVYKKDPSSFTGRPRMPKYCRLDKKTFKVTNHLSLKMPHLPVTRICQTWQEWILAQITSQLSHAQTVRLLYTKAVRSCQLTSSLPNKRRPQSPSSPEEKLVVMQRLHS